MTAKKLKVFLALGAITAATLVSGSPQAQAGFSCPSSHTHSISSSSFHHTLEDHVAIEFVYGSYYNWLAANYTHRLYQGFLLNYTYQTGPSWTC
jgi:hypothetical protein